MSNWNWGKPEYNGIKVLILVLVLAFMGYFVFNSMHNNSLENTARVTKGGSALGGVKGGTLAACPDTGSHGLVPMIGAPLPTTTAGSASGATGVTGTFLPMDTANYLAGNFVLDNPYDCDMQVDMMKFSLHESFPMLFEGWERIRLMDTTAGQQFGATLALPATDAIHSMTFTNTPSTSGINFIIPAHTTERFSMYIDSYNLPPTLVPASANTFNVQFYAFNSHWYYGPFNLSYAPVTSPVMPLLMAGTITLVYP